MRRLNTALMAALGACLGLGACGQMSQMMGDGPADMTEHLPPQGRADRHAHGHPRPGEEPDYVDAASPSLGPDRNDAPDPGMGPHDGVVTLGQGGADITPRPSTPDTEVRYGANSH